MVALGGVSLGAWSFGGLAVGWQALGGCALAWNETVAAAMAISAAARRVFSVAKQIFTPHTPLETHLRMAGSLQSTPKSIFCT